MDTTLHPKRENSTLMCTQLSAERGQRMKQYAESFYKSRIWQNTREAYMKSKGGLCEECYAQGICNAGEIVHHIKPITKNNIGNPDITLSWENLRLLCRACHEHAHRRTPKRYTVDEYGRVTPTGL